MKPRFLLNVNNAVFECNSGNAGALGSTRNELPGAIATGTKLILVVSAAWVRFETKTVVEQHQG
jgi:hypothetical protein